MEFNRSRKVLIQASRGTDRDSPAAPDTDKVRRTGQDQKRDNQESPKTDKAEQEVPENSRNGHVSKDSDSAGRVGTSEDRGLAGPADMHTEKARHASAHTETATKKGYTEKAGQSERNTLRGAQVDVYEEKTRRQKVDAIPKSTSQSEKSGKQKKMELRRRSKIKVLIKSQFLTFHVCSSALN